ncbi:hypothetical protein FKR81_04530 [Lentzea tibetensis]|uniref:Uncharacterized protein n=1 Tax=Lentzea tibetensis TaxID=2591470 RepID=A0A563F0G4_9PSEU|nr:hypothetical protein [Lentzea tibetensis]TWP53241.1 hypothetical protein FKR81_04530 [Lentzea tibetensis]
MNDTEQLIKEALNRQADRAPHPGPTLSALRRPARRRSRSSLFLTVGTAVAAAAVLFAAGVLVGKGPSPDNGAAALLPTTTPSASTHVKFSPGWLPDGFVEVYRSAGPDGIVRVWTTEPSADPPFATAKPMVSLSVDGNPEGFETWEQVALANGATGYVQVTQGQTGPGATIVWRAPDVLRVTVRGVPDVRATAVQIAGAVQPDDKSVVRSAVEYQGLSLPRVWGASPSRWTSEIRVDPFTAQVSTDPPDLTGGKPVDVRGKQGTYVPGKYVAVLDRGVWLTVTGQLTEGQLVKIANDIKIDPKPGYDWIGH